MHSWCGAQLKKAQGQLFLLSLWSAFIVHNTLIIKEKNQQHFHFSVHLVCYFNYYNAGYFHYDDHYLVSGSQLQIHISSLIILLERLSSVSRMVSLWPFHAKSHIRATG
jgi:hypothetical protein